MKTNLLTYLEQRKKDTPNVSKDMELGRSEVIKWVREYEQPGCFICQARLPDRRSKYCKPCSSDRREAQGRIYQ